MESKTLNQIFEGFEQFALNHPSIHSYDLGTELKLDIKKNEQFAKMFVLIGPATYNNPSVTPNFQIQIVDKVLTDKKNQTWYINEVMSDLLQVCTDLTMYLKTERLISPGAQISYNPVFYEHDNVLAGWSFNIVISAEMTISSCYINPLTEKAVRCIEANNEYLSSPAGSYLPSSSDDLDIEIVYDNLDEDGTTTVKSVVSVRNTVFPPDDNINIYFNSTFLSLNIRVGSDNIISHDFTTSIPISGNIKVVGRVGFIDLLFNDVVVSTITGTIDLSTIINKEVNFNKIASGGSILAGLDYSYIKINNHEWISANWQSPITTNSQGVQTTLHSDISTDAMIIDL